MDWRKHAMPILMPALMKRLTDIAIILAVASGIAFLIIASANSLVAKIGIWKSYSIWLAVISRPDIVVTTLLTIAVTMAVLAYNQGKGRR
jgi:hypothetical protein